MHIVANQIIGQHAVNLFSSEVTHISAFPLTIYYDFKLRKENKVPFCHLEKNLARDVRMKNSQITVSVYIENIYHKYIS